MHHHGLEFQMENLSFALENRLDTGIYIIHDYMCYKLYLLMEYLLYLSFNINFYVSLSSLNTSHPYPQPHKIPFYDMLEVHCYCLF